MNLLWICVVWMPCLYTCIVRIFWKWASESGFSPKVNFNFQKLLCADISIICLYFSGTLIWSWGCARLYHHTMINYSNQLILIQRLRSYLLFCHGKTTSIFSHNYLPSLWSCIQGSIILQYCCYMYLLCQYGFLLLCQFWVCNMCAYYSVYQL